MRYAVLVLAILGALASGFLGYRWYSDYQNLKGMMADVRAAGAGNPEVGQAAAQFDKLGYAAYSLLAALPLGIVGGVLAFARLGWIGAIVMLLPVIAAVALVAGVQPAPGQQSPLPGTLIFTSP